MRIALLVVADITEDTEEPLMMLGPAMAVVGECISKKLTMGSMLMSPETDSTDTVTYQTKVMSDDFAVGMSLIPREEPQPDVRPPE